MNKKIFMLGMLLVAGTSIIYAQQQKETQIEEVTLASKLPQDIRKTGKNVTLLTAKDLEKYKGQNLNDVLDQVAGIQITGNFNNQTEPKSLRIRGGKSSNVMILLDGIPLKDVTGGDYTVSDLRLLSLENVESIEVMNGASSVLYGSNATVSVINIHTKKSASKPIEGLLSLRGGSFSTFAQDASVRGKLNHFYYQVNAFNEKSQGFSSAEGDDSFDKDGWEKQNLSATVGYSKNNLDVNVKTGWNHNLYDYDYGAFADGNERGDDKQFFVDGKANFRYNKGTLVFNTRYLHNSRLYQDWETDAYQDQYLYKGDDFIAELYNAYQFTDFFKLTVGAQFEKQSMEYSELPWGGTSMEIVNDYDDTNTSTFDVFANAHFNYEGFNLDAGTRMTNHSKFNTHWVYSINPYYLGETGNLFYKIGYSYATAFIAPTLYQSFGALPYILPNFDLEPETNQSHEIDLSIGKKDRSLVFNASLYQRKEKNGFVYTVTDYTTYAGMYLNVDKNTIKGFDLGFDYKINEYIGLGGNFSFVEKDDESSMLRIPKQRVNSYVEIKPFRSTRINLSHQFISKRSDAYYNSATWSTDYVENKSYNLFNLNINQQITKRISGYLNVGNLFNTSYVDVVGYKTRPRNYTVGFNYQF